jgi:hypothetical protein
MLFLEKKILFPYDFLESKTLLKTSEVKCSISERLCKNNVFVQVYCTLIY